MIIVDTTDEATAAVHHENIPTLVTRRDDDGVGGGQAVGGGQGGWRSRAINRVRSSLCVAPSYGHPLMTDDISVLSQWTPAVRCAHMGSQTSSG